MNRIFSFPVIAMLVLTLGISACVDPTAVIIRAAIRKDEERATVSGKGLREAHFAMIEKMKAEGDPMGDYLWVRANEDEFIPNPVTDQKKLKEMYQSAASKGSIDAEIKAALISFYEGAATNGSYKKITEIERQQKTVLWRQGLKEIEVADAKQCYYWGIVLDGMANRRCLRPVVTADNVWPYFRDGFAYPKDQNIRVEWEAKADACQAFLNKQPPQFFFNRNFPACRR